MICKPSLWDINEWNIYFFHCLIVISSIQLYCFRQWWNVTKGVNVMKVCKKQTRFCWFLTRGIAPSSLNKDVSLKYTQIAVHLIKSGIKIQVFMGEIDMEITPEHARRIQDIMGEMQCPKDFECYKSGFEELCKVRIICNGQLIECLEEKAQPCKLGFCFGYGYFCDCLLRKYIARNFKI